MNKKIIFILIITLTVLAGLTFYTFGSGAHRLSLTTNPNSLKPTPVVPSVKTPTVVFNAYHNKDIAENFYTIQFPAVWQLGPNQPGEYAFAFKGGSAKVETMDVPDNSTLELFVLSQDEPKLKSSIAGYKRIDYQKISLNGVDAYQLMYASMRSGTAYQTIRTYITGADKAGVITLSSFSDKSASLSPAFSAIINSFRWEK